MSALGRNAPFCEAAAATAPDAAAAAAHAAAARRSRVQLSIAAAGGRLGVERSVCRICVVGASTVVDAGQLRNLMT